MRSDTNPNSVTWSAKAPQPLIHSQAVQWPPGSKPFSTGFANPWISGEANPGTVKPLRISLRDMPGASSKLCVLRRLAAQLPRSSRGARAALRAQAAPIGPWETTLDDAGRGTSGPSVGVRRLPSEGVEEGAGRGDVFSGRGG